MDSFEEKLDFISDQLAALSAQIAEEKKAIGNLWKKVDELQISSSNDIEYISKQLSEWTQTNLRAIFFGGDRAGDAVRWRICLIHPNLSSTSSKWYCWASAL